MLDLLSLKRGLDEKGVFLYFHGQISQGLVIQIGDLLKQKMAMEEVKSQTILKVFSMFVEQAQNIMHYSAPDCVNGQSETAELQAGVLAVGYDGEDYFVASGNKVDMTEVNRIRTRLEKIRSMDKDQLKVFYKEMRKANASDDSKGAGLGFIEMARNSSKPLEFEFSEINDRESFFTLITIINRE